MTRRVHYPLAVLAAIVCLSWQAAWAGNCGCAPHGGCGSHGCGRVGLLTLLRGCHGGCGEIYWNEWWSDPPQPCDPCDFYGNYAGPNPCGRPIWHNGSRIFGSRADWHAAACGMRGGCGPCGAAGHAPGGYAPGGYASNDVAPLPPPQAAYARDGASQPRPAPQTQTPESRDVRWAAWPSNRQSLRR